MAAGDIWACRWVWGNANTAEEMTSTLHAIEGASPPDVADVGDAFKNWWNVAADGVAYRTLVPAAITLNSVTLRKVVPLSALEESYTTGLPLAGTLAGDPSPSQVCVLASLRTASIGRSFRGRLYLPGVGEGKIGVNGSLVAADATDIRDQIGSLFAELGTNALLSPCVLSRFTNGAERPTPIGTPITNVKVDRILRTQRRRTENVAVYV